MSVGAAVVVCLVSRVGAAWVGELEGGVQCLLV